MFFKKKKDISKDPFYPEKDCLVLYIECGKCGEKMFFKLLKERDFMVAYDGRSAIMIDKLYVCPKCYNQISVKAGFKSNYRTVYFEINGGRFIEREEYERKEDER